MLGLRIIFPFVACMLLYSCLSREDDIRPCESECTVVKGRFTTNGGHKGISAMPVEAYWALTPYMGHHIIRRKAFAITDSDGYYTFTFQVREEEMKDGYFEIKFITDANRFLYHGDPTFHVGKLTRDTTVTLHDYLLPRKAYVEIQLKNQHLVTGNKTFITQFSYTNGLCTGLEFSCGGGVYVWGPESPAITLAAIAGNQPTTITTSKMIDGVYTHRIDTINVPAGLRTTYAVDFLK